MTSENNNHIAEAEIAGFDSSNILKAVVDTPTTSYQQQPQQPQQQLQPFPQQPQLQQSQPQVQKVQDRTRVAAIPTTQQKRHNSQSYLLQGNSTKRGAIFSPSANSALIYSTPTFSSMVVNPSSSQVPINSINSVQKSSQNQRSPIQSFQQINSASNLSDPSLSSANSRKFTPLSSVTPKIRMSPNVQSQNIQSSNSIPPQLRLNKTPTPSMNFELPSSPKSKAIARVFEPDMSVEGSSELNDGPNSRGRVTSEAQQSVNSPDSFPDSQQQQQQQGSLNGQPRRPSTETMTSQQPPQQQPTQQEQQRQQQKAISSEEQLLASNLHETYKAILKLESETQQGCIEVNEKLMENDASAEITPELWLVYKKCVSLLDHYYDFLLYALSPSSARAGKSLVTNYRILKRMWIFGIVAFLEVIKNVTAIFVEHEVCSCFISYAFNIISCLTDPALGIEGYWAEKLGDLSRMAIALYPARYMDWKVVSVYWYQLAMMTQFGHGKIYYHMCTVESDNLEALVEIGKSVTCRDPFTPTSQYLRMIVDNACSQRNILSSIEMAMIDFVKIHKILLLPNFNTNQEMANLVSHYASNFGLDSSNIDYFSLTGQLGTSIPIDKANFWFQKGPNFSICNINHLIGFGDSRNPFAKLFELPEALRERREKKDKKRKSKAYEGNEPNDNTKLSDVEYMFCSTASEQDESSWFPLMDFINKGVLELSIKMLKQYITGPIHSSTGHVIIWLYFIIAVGEALKKYPSAKPMMLYFIHRYIPWMKLVPYLNDILFLVRSDEQTRALMKEHMSPEFQAIHGNSVKYFAENEKLWEPWKCWGSLWFDFVALKKDYTSVFETGVKEDIFDLPTSGPRYNPKGDSQRYLRIVLLATHIATNYSFGLIRKDNVFQFEIINSLYSIEVTNASAAVFAVDPRFQYSFDDIVPGFTNRLEDQGVSANSADEERWCAPVDGRSLSWNYNSAKFLEEHIDVFSSDLHNNNSPKLDDMYVNEDYANGGNATDVESDGNEDDSNPNRGPPNSVYTSMPLIGKSTEGNLGDRMDTALTHISLDTNTWLKHCGRIFKCVRSDIFKLSVPLTVFQELRSLRRADDAVVADSATRAVLIVRQLFAERDVLAVRADGTQASSLAETTEFEQNTHWRSNTDELIMNCVKLNNDLGRSLLIGNNMKINHNNKVLSVEEAREFRYNVLVSDDRNMALRSRANRFMILPSKWLFTQIEKVSQGRCTD